MDNSKNILIVDDSDELTNVISDFLSMFGYCVHTAKDGIDALKRLEGQSMTSWSATFTCREWMDTL